MPRFRRDRAGRRQRPGRGRQQPRGTGAGRRVRPVASGLGNGGRGRLQRPPAVRGRGKRRLRARAQPHGRASLERPDPSGADRLRGRVRGCTGRKGRLRGLRGGSGRGLRGNRQARHGSQSGPRRGRQHPGELRRRRPADSQDLWASPRPDGGLAGDRDVHGLRGHGVAGTALARLLVPAPTQRLAGQRRRVGRDAGGRGLTGFAPHYRGALWIPQRRERGPRPRSTAPSRGAVRGDPHRPQGLPDNQVSPRRDRGDARTDRGTRPRTRGGHRDPGGEAAGALRGDRLRRIAAIREWPRWPG